MRTPTRVLLTLILVPMLFNGRTVADDNVYEFTTNDRAFLERFAWHQLTPIAPDKSNAVADSEKAASLGHKLFFDRRLSANGEVSCASCHAPEQYFTDGKVVSVGIGKARRNAPSIPGAIRSQWLYWDGRKDSLWSQALTPLEHPNEHGLSRLGVVQKVIAWYEDEYQEVFGSINTKRIQRLKSPASPLGDSDALRNWERLSKRERKQINRIFSDIGKALMAYERRLELGPARFDQFIQQVVQQAPLAKLKQTFSPEEVAGMRLFMGQGNCASCHNGPLLSNAEFHNVGAPEPDEQAVDLGRHGAIPQLLADEFTCLSQWSDAPDDCEEMRFLKRQGPELVGAFRTPSLRNVAATAPYMQSGQLATLEQVVAHYNTPKPPFYDRAQHPNRPHFDILPLRLDERQSEQLVAFLKTLTSPIPDSRWWKAPEGEDHNSGSE